MGKPFDLLPLFGLACLAIGLVALLILVLRLIHERRVVASLHEQMGRRLAEIHSHEQSTRERDRVRQRLIGAMSHDMRQPIQAMSLYLRRLEVGLASSWVPEAEREAVLHSQRGLRYGLGYMSSLLDGVLDITQLMQGSLAVRAEPVSIRGLFGRLYAEQGSLFQEQGGRLELIVPEGDDAWVRSDERLLERVLRNLLANALRYAPGSRVRMKAFREHDRVCLMVSDVGPGMPRARRQQVRQELQRDPKGELSGSLHGVGLGLVIVRQIAIRIGAQISMSSHSGLGTSFLVRLPGSSPPDLLSIIARSEREGLSPASPDPGPKRVGGGARSLVVVLSETPQDQQALRVALMSEFREVLAYRDAAEALSKLGSLGLIPQLLVIDEVKGEPNPMDTAEHFESEFNDWIPTIILTDGHAQLAPASAGRGWVRVLTRPFGPDQLNALATRATEAQSLRR